MIFCVSKIDFKKKKKIDMHIYRMLGTTQMNHFFSCIFKPIKKLHIYIYILFGILVTIQIVKKDIILLRLFQLPKKITH